VPTNVWFGSWLQIRDRRHEEPADLELAIERLAVRRRSP